MNPAYIPNSYQTPNVLVDEIMPLLTPQEWVVLSFATRRILGWADNLKSRQAEISVSQFENTGLSRPAIVAALNGLEAYHLLTKIGKAGKNGQRWELSYDADVDVDGLRERKLSQQKRNSDRTSKARASGKSDLPVNGTNRKWSVGLTATGKSDLHNETHIQTQETHTIAPAKAVATSETIKPSHPEKLEIEIELPRDSGIKPKASKSVLEKTPSKVPPKVSPVQPHIALIDAWLAALPAKPIGNQYNRNVRVASEMHKAGITPQQITDYVTELYTDAFWQKQTVSMEHIAKNIPLWLAKRNPPKQQWYTHPDPAKRGLRLNEAQYNAAMKELANVKR